MTEQQQIEWDPTQFFDHAEPRVPYVLLILNQPINDRAFAAIQEHASAIICADGGANHYYDLKKSQGKEDTALPSAIIGDLDSIRPEVRRHYEERDVPVLYDPDQYSTDFTKCLKYIRNNADIIAPSLSDLTSQAISNTRAKHPPHASVEDQPDEDGHATSSSALETRNEDTETTTRASATSLDVLVLGGLGGRVDQAFSQMHHLYMAALHNQQSSSPPSASDTAQETEKAKEESRSDIRLYLVSEESISFILLPGLNKILTPGTDRPRSNISPRTPAPTMTTDAELPTTSEPDLNKNNKKGGREDEEFFLSECVGIIPLNGPAAITTSGLEWDVTDWKTEIGGQISTSNHIRADQVTVSTNQPVLFTAELARRFKIGGRTS